MQKKKMPLFWKFYIGYMSLLIVAVVALLVVLWRFLATYELTRPVHAMEKAMNLLAEAQREELLSYLEPDENAYESSEVIVEALFDSVSGKELGFGKLSGVYTERHPVFALTADDATVAKFAFAESETEESFHMHGWELESITICSDSLKSVAITVPETMKVFVNNTEAREVDIVRTSDSGMPVEYVDYNITGLVEEPKITAADRFGNPVELSRDENGAYYFQMSYVKAPRDMKVSVGDVTLSDDNIFGEEAYDELSVIAQLEKELPEFEHLSEMITVPKYEKYFVDYPFNPDELVITDAQGLSVEPEYDESTRTYRVKPVSGNSCYDEATAFAMSFLEDYTLFCSNDQELSSIEKYFPEDSNYLELISHMNNNSFIRHSDTVLKNRSIDDYFEYSDSLIYVHATIDEWMHLTRYGYDKVYRVELPVWIVKIDGKWYVAKIDYENFKQL